jgi:hypothetical protein
MVSVAAWVKLEGIYVQQSGVLLHKTLYKPSHSAQDLVSVMATVGVPECHRGKTTNLVVHAPSADLHTCSALPFLA